MVGVGGIVGVGVAAGVAVAGIAVAVTMITFGSCGPCSLRLQAARKVQSARYRIQSLRAEKDFFMGGIMASGSGCVNNCSPTIT
jgi:hypothetical protein